MPNVLSFLGGMQETTYVLELLFNSKIDVNELMDIPSIIQDLPKIDNDLDFKIKDIKLGAGNNCHYVLLL